MKQRAHHCALLLPAALLAAAYLDNIGVGFVAVTAVEEAYALLAAGR